MAKRFTDTTKWQLRWFRNLTPANKLFWHYLNDACDHAGFWNVDFGLASFQLSQPLDEEEVLEVFADKVTVLEQGDKWFIKDFVEFQYGELKPTNNTHKSVLKLLSKYSEGLGRGLAGAKDKDQDKAKDMVMEKAKEEDKTKHTSKPFKRCHLHNIDIWGPFERCPKCEAGEPYSFEIPKQRSDTVM